MASNLGKSLSDLNEAFLQYSAIVEKQVRTAVNAFLDCDEKAAQTVFESDLTIDQLEIKIEKDCQTVIALHQPYASDLRFIFAILKMNNDLERIGDLAKNIAKKASLFRSHGQAFYKQYAQKITDMSDKALDMLHKSLDAFANRDITLATAVCLLDDEVDQLQREFKVETLHHMKTHSEYVALFSGLLSNASHLERIADLATNIAQDVLYLVEGDIVRHMPA